MPKKVEDCDAKNENLVHYIYEVLQNRDERVESECNTTDNDSSLSANNSQKITLEDGFPREVKLWSFITRVTEIDTRNTSFNVFFTLASSWIETDPKRNIGQNICDFENIKEGPKKCENKEEGSEKWKLGHFAWYPQLRFLNLIEEDEEFQDEWFRVVPEKHNEPGIAKGSLRDYKENYVNDHNAGENMIVTHYMKRKLTLAEYFELEDFPVDLQSLHIQVSTSWDCHNALLSFCDKNPSSYEPRALDSQEFELHHPRLISYDSDWENDDLPLLSNADHSITGVRYSRAYIALTITRKPNYYVWNISVMLSILGTLSFTLFGTDVEYTVERLGNLFTLVLAIIAYKLVLSNDLPAIAYLTRLDKFTMSSIANLSIIGAGMAIINSCVDTDEQEFFDKWLLCITAFFWFGINIWYYFTSLFKLKKRRKKVVEIEKKFEDRKHGIEKTNKVSRRRMGGLSIAPKQLVLRLMSERRTSQLSVTSQQDMFEDQGDA